jgi:hypothetical protein
MPLSISIGLICFHPKFRGLSTAAQGAGGRAVKASAHYKAKGRNRNLAPPPRSLRSLRVTVELKGHSFGKRTVQRVSNPPRTLYSVVTSSICGSSSNGTGAITGQALQGRKDLGRVMATAAGAGRVPGWRWDGKAASLPVFRRHVESSSFKGQCQLSGLHERRRS